VIIGIGAVLAVIGLVAGLAEWHTGRNTVLHGAASAAPGARQWR
jgi:hypothetical protein